jgi:hypothetical protein
MSSHREAPEISRDPVADNTDTYAFVSPDHPDTVTIISNYIPLEAAAAGPNFYEFGEDVRYRIYVSNDSSGQPNIAYEFHFTTHVLDGKTFLYDTGPIGSIHDPHFNRRQTGHPGRGGAADRTPRLGCGRSSPVPAYFPYLGTPHDGFDTPPAS